MEKEINELLQELGVTANYMGYYHSSYAVSLAVRDREYLLSVTKSLYPEVARHYNTSATAVERNIRTVVSYVWNHSQGTLMEIARCRLSDKPTASQFIAILAAHLKDLH